MRSCLTGQRLSAWRSTISQRKVTMTITSSWDVKKACAKLPLFGLSFGFVHPDGSSRCVAHGGSSITMGLSTSPQCLLNTSARSLKRRSSQQASRASEPLKHRNIRDREKIKETSMISERKVVLITGASRGMGAALVAAYRDRDYGGG